MNRDTLNAIVILMSLVNYTTVAPSAGDAALLNAAHHLEKRDPAFCSACGSQKEIGQSCGCFDNGCQ
jgi:hypothetical protein